MIPAKRTYPHPRINADGFSAAAVAAPRQRLHAPLCLLALWLGTLTGCAHLADPAATHATEPACAARFAAVDRATRAAKQHHSATWQLPGYPFLRSDRLLAALAARATTAPARAAWLAALAAHDDEARRLEHAALPATVAAGLPTPDVLAECRARLVARLRDDPAALDQMRAASQVPDDYRGWQRALGGYSLLAPFVRRGVARLHRQHPVASEAPAAPGQAYAPGEEQAAAALPDWHHLPRDALGRPHLPPPQMAALLRRHAPAWQIRGTGAADRIGAPAFGRAGPRIDTARPTMYAYASHTLFADTVLLQLNYVIWFPARPAEGAFDLLAGDFDGLTWRVTLDTDGTPLVHDVMHNCGCYHQWFPGPRLRRRPSAPADGEPLWLPWGEGVSVPGPAPVIHLAAGTHYVTALTAGGPAAALPLGIVGYHELYRLPQPDGGPRPLFDADGLLRASARGERFVLWPLGVPSPGAMRGRGHHAVAFIGRRHFDEAALLDRYFVRARN